jgi:large subunit ribosomal protein L17
VNSLVEHGRITTTVAKAKELRRHVERAITMGKKNSLHAKRLLLSRYPHPATVDRIVDTWSPHFSQRPGGYTRIIKVGNRTGDCAEMAIIELLDYSNIVTKGEPKAEKATKKSAKP